MTRIIWHKDSRIRLVNVKIRLYGHFIHHVMVVGQLLPITHLWWSVDLVKCLVGGLGPLPRTVTHHQL